MRQSHGTTPTCVAAFALAHQTRRFALLHAVRHGYVTALDVRHEFPLTSRTNAHEVLHVLRDKGLLTPDKFVLDVQGKLRQLTYVPSPAGRAALEELRDWLNTYLSTLDLDLVTTSQRPGQVEQTFQRLGQQLNANLPGRLEADLIQCTADPQDIFVVNPSEQPHRTTPEFVIDLYTHSVLTTLEHASTAQEEG